MTLYSALAADNIQVLLLHPKLLTHVEIGKLKAKLQDFII